MVDQKIEVHEPNCCCGCTGEIVLEQNVYQSAAKEIMQMSKVNSFFNSEIVKKYINENDEVENK